MTEPQILLAVIALGIALVAGGLGWLIARLGSSWLTTGSWGLDWEFAAHLLAVSLLQLMALLLLNRFVPLLGDTATDSTPPP